MAQPQTAPSDQPPGLDASDAATGGGARAQSERLPTPATPSPGASSSPGPGAKAIDYRAFLATELGRRVASALAMAAVALALTLAGGWWFAGLVGAAVAVMSWEWGRLVRGGEAPQEQTATQSVSPLEPLTLVQGAACLAAVTLAAAGAAGIGLLCLVAGASLLGWLDRGRPLSAVGVAYVGLPALVLVWLRGDPALGLAAVLYLFLVVWMTDIAAYFWGRRIGGPRLAPTISPGKTWSGFLGGVTTSAVAALGFALVVPASSPAYLFLLALVLGVTAQAGDLAESALKRRSGAKDASRLIPGHGGLLDRVDGLVAAVTLAALFVILRLASGTSAGPARALLLGA